jgi:hypothetical protein
MMLEDAKPSLLITTDDQLPRFSDLPWKAFVTTPLAGADANRWRWQSRSRRPTSSLPPAPPGARKG